MNKIDIKIIEMPEAIRGCCTYLGEKDGDDLYKIFINASLSDSEREKTLKHEMLHIELDHFKSGISAHKAEREVKAIIGA